MKKFTVMFLLLVSFPLFAESKFQASLINNNKYLSVHISDDESLPPFEAKALWNAIKINDEIKMISEKELMITCDRHAITEDDGNFGSCAIMIPFSQFKKVGSTLVFKAEGSLAAKLNRYFIDSAYVSFQNNKAFLSSRNTMRQFSFGISEDLIQK